MPKDGPSRHRMLRKGVLSGLKSQHSLLGVLEVQDKVNAALLERLAEILPEKLAEQGITTSVVAKSSSEQVRNGAHFVRSLLGVGTVLTSRLCFLVDGTRPPFSSISSPECSLREAEILANRLSYHVER